MGVISRLIAAASCSATLLFLSTLVAQAQNVDAPRALDKHAPALVSRILLLTQQQVQHPTAPLSEAEVQSISRTIGFAIRDAGGDDTGARVLALPAVVKLDEARRLVGLLRRRNDAVWAELDRSALTSREQKAAAANELAKIGGITRLVVTLNDVNTQRVARANGTLQSTWDDVLSAAAGTRLRVVRPTVGGAWVVALPGTVNYIEAAAIGAKLTSSGIARFADPDTPVYQKLVPNDPGFAQAPQWALYDERRSTSFYGINAPEAWDVTTGASSLVVAVVDTGVLPHPEFSSRLLQGYDFVSNPANSHDGLGRHASGLDPGNWHTFADCPSETPAPSNWHGTHVAGIIGATGNNASGIAGLNWQSRILPVRVLGTCGAMNSTIDILEGMMWAAGLPVPGVPTNPNPARVINMSLGGPGVCTPQYQTLVNLVLASGSLVVASAGNDDGVADNKIPGACFGLSTVGATGPYGFRAPYSNFSFTLDISAPGGDQQTYGINGGIWSTWNTGITTAGTFGYQAYQGTSQAAPQVSGVASLMLSINPTLTPAQLKALMAETAAPFPEGSACNLDVCGAGIVDAAAAVLAAKALVGQPPPVANYGGLWWAEPAGSESGWGINFTHQGDVIFATWFTYDSLGKAWWLSMTANKNPDGTYTGTLYETHGPSFNAVPFSPAAVTATPVGSGVLLFTSPNEGLFAYTVRGISQVKAIAREVFGPLPVCAFGLQPNLTLATNYQDLWWASPAGSESGWGINLTHQGNIIFGTWFTYNFDGSPLWLSVTAQNTAYRTYSGTLYLTAGPAFSAVPFSPSAVTATPVGTATFVFADGDSGTFSYSVSTNTGAISQTKAIVREVLKNPGTVCQ